MHQPRSPPSGCRGRCDRGGGQSDLDVRVPPHISLFAPRIRPSRGSARRSCRRSSRSREDPEVAADSL
eukprot:9693351-Heterocapsa_arctica.AAC.1